MAPTHSKPSPNKLRTQRKLVIPPIGLERPTEKKDYAKGEFATVKLRNVPNDATSMTYDYQVPFFTTGTPEEWLKFKARFNRVITGQHMTTAVQKYACARRFLQGQALSTFNNMADEQPNVNMANFDLCLNHVNESMFPQKAYITQTRWMRRYLRKPREMKTRDYVNRVLELNGYLTEFPTSNNNQANKLEDDEIMDILEFSLPSRWRSTMVLQGFNAAEKTTAEFIEFCERLEMTEPESEMADDRIPKKKQSELYDQELDQEQPFKGVISATCFAIRSTVHTTTQHTPMQLVFGRDAILNIAHEANWKLIKDRKQKLIDQNNKRENASRKPHTYNVGDKVLIKNDWSAKYRKVAFLGPYPITNVNDNGTVRVALNDIVTDVYNIRNVRPFRE